VKSASFFFTITDKLQVFVFTITDKLQGFFDLKFCRICKVCVKVLYDWEMLLS